MARYANPGAGCDICPLHDRCVINGEPIHCTSERPAIISDADIEEHNKRLESKKYYETLDKEGYDK